MTEYEMASLANDMTGTASVLFLNWISVVTAFLVAGYLVSHRMNGWMIATLLLVYSYVYYGMVIPMFGQIANLQGLGRKMEAFANAGSGLEWHSIGTRGLPPQWVWSATDIVNVVAFAVVYLVSIAFFVQCRHMNRNAEVAALAPKV